jgi:polyhydroxybutyrate depolymerase
MRCWAALLVGVFWACAPTFSDTKRPSVGTHRIQSVEIPPGKSRNYLLHVPVRWQSRPSLPLVVALHGAFSTARKFARESGWNALAESEGFLVAYPEGFGLFGLLQHWNAGHCCGKAAADNFDDVGFIDAVIEDICEALPVDRQRIYITGFSNGGMLAHRYAAERSVHIAAAAAVGAAVGGHASADLPIWKPPKPTATVPMLIIHGRDDRNVPYDGGGAAKGHSERVYLSVQDAVHFWADHNGCSLRSHQVLQQGVVTVERWRGEAPGAEVMLYSIEGWGHHWPGPYFINRLSNGDQWHGFDATRQIWQFFSMHIRIAP